MNHFELLLLIWSLVGMAMLFAFIDPLGKLLLKLSQLQCLIIFFFFGPIIFILSSISLILVWLPTKDYSKITIELNKFFQYLFSPIVRFWKWAGTINFIEIK